MSVIIGHRGSSSYPENTLRAIDYALRNGADGVEIDVRSTADGVLVLSHDDNLRRLTGKDIAIKSLTTSSMREVRVMGELLATLEDALALVRSYGKLLDIEVKKPSDFPMVGKTIRASGCTELFVSSFWHRAALDFKLAQPGIPIGFIYSHHPSEISVYASQADYLKPHYTYVDEAYAPYRHRTIVWTINDLPIAQEFLMRGIGVVSDVPGRLVAGVRQRPGHARSEDPSQ